MNRSLVVALALAAAPLTLQAQDPWELEAGLLMVRAINIAADRGYTTTAQATYRGRLADGRSEQLQLTLDPAFEHMIVAVCDVDCSDIDLAVLEANGQEVDADRDADDTPIVFVPAGHPGGHPLRVSMPGCSVDPCRYEVAVFGRQPATGQRPAVTARRTEAGPASIPVRRW